MTRSSNLGAQAITAMQVALIGVSLIVTLVPTARSPALIRLFVLLFFVEAAVFTFAVYKRGHLRFTPEESYEALNHRNTRYSRGTLERIAVGASWIAALALVFR